MTEKGFSSAESLDVFAHGNPAFVALILRWLCEGYGDQVRKEGRKDDAGLLFIWGLVGTALVGTEKTSHSLPVTAKKNISNLFYENPSWRAGLTSAVEAWSASFWRGLGYGVCRDVLSFSDGRIYAVGSVAPATVIWLQEISRHSKALGRVFAKETDMTLFSTILGLDVILESHR